MLHIKEAIVVEGRYDKNTLAQLVDALIVETTGFGIFSNEERLHFLRRLAEARGLIVLTDSDGAGFVIRNFLKGAIPPAQLKHAYIPDVHGKERRKRQWGKEQKLGVEGMSPAILEEALRRAGATILDETQSEPRTPISSTDLYLLGLSGRAGSAQRRAALLQHLDLPEHLSSKALLPVLNALYTREELLPVAEKLGAQGF